MNLGKSLIRSHRSENRQVNRKNYMMKHQQTDIAEFLDTKKYLDEEDDWEGHIRDMCFPVEEAGRAFSNETDSASAINQIDASRSHHPIALKIPQRPQWDYTQTKEEVLLREAHYFSKWRGAMRELEKRSLPYPCLYEKNIELWRQLWRVTERCDVIMKIVDCRNPNVYRCLDLEKIIAGNNKMLILVLNKADLISETQRRAWANYLKSKKINFIFFSSTSNEESTSNGQCCKQEKASVESHRSRKAHRLRGSISHKIFVPENVGSKRTTTFLCQQDSNAMDTKQPNRLKFDEKLFHELKLSEYLRITLENFHSILNSHIISDPKMVRTMLGTIQEIREVISKHFQRKASENSASGNEKHDGEILKIALVGFPNVGKSSFFNALTIQKKAATGARPGKTKYFQSMYLHDNQLVMIHDSPGILFPMLSRSVSSSLCEGKVCLQSSKDHERHLVELCKHVKLETIETYYKVKIPQCKNLKLEEYIDVLLTTIAYARGHVGGFNQPLKNVTALRIFRDYVKGNLVFVAPPPLESNEYSELLSILRHDDGFHEGDKYDKMMLCVSKIFEKMGFAINAEKKVSNFFVPIEAFPEAEQPYLFYELFFNS